MCVCVCFFHSMCNAPTVYTTVQCCRSHRVTEDPEKHLKTGHKVIVVKFSIQSLYIVHNVGTFPDRNELHTWV